MERLALRGLVLKEKGKLIRLGLRQEENNVAEFFPTLCWQYPRKCHLRTELRLSELVLKATASAIFLDKTKVQIGEV